MRNWKVVAAVMMGMALGASLYAQQKKAPTLTAADRVEIGAIYAKYAWHVDARDGKTWASLFTPDGEFVYPNGRKDVGTAELEKSPLRLGVAGPTTAVHIATNIWIEPTAEGAHGGAYLLNVIPPHEGKPAAITAIAFYEDRFVKTKEGWKIKQRRAHSKGGLTPSVVIGTATN